MAGFERIVSGTSTYVEPSLNFVLYFKFEEEHFGRSWREFFRTYNGYFDGATKQTLSIF